MWTTLEEGEKIFPLLKCQKHATYTLVTWLLMSIFLMLSCECIAIGCFTVWLLLCDVCCVSLSADFCRLFQSYCCRVLMFGACFIMIVTEWCLMPAPVCLLLSDDVWSVFQSDSLSEDVWSVSVWLTEWWCLVCVSVWLTDWGCSVFVSVWLSLSEDI